MTDQQGTGAGSGAGSGSSSQGAGAGAGSVNAAQGAANPPPEYNRPGIPENPRSRGISPARDFREGQQRQAGEQGAPGGEQHVDPGQQGTGTGTGTPQTIKIGDVEYTHDQVNQAIARSVEQDARRAALPQDPRGYKAELPADFKAPEGVKFEFDQNSPDLARFRQVAHANGLDQKQFSDALGVFAATKIGEQQNLATARGTELAKLGSAAEGRIAAIDTWLKARGGGNGAALLVAQLKNFPVAAMVETFEGLIRQFSNQGGADYSQSGRQQEDNSGKIPGYDNMNFAQKRAAQDALAARGRR